MGENQTSAFDCDYVSVTNAVPLYYPVQDRRERLVQMALPYSGHVESAIEEAKKIEAYINNG